MLLFAADPPTQTSQAITFSIVAAVFALITLIYNTRSKRKDTAIAAAAEVAREMRQAERDQVAAAQVEKLATLERHTERIEKSQDVMHAMLNSAQTSQMIAFIVTQKASRASLRTQYAQMRDLAALRGTEKDPQTLAELATLQDQITQLGNDIAAQQDAVDDRLRAQELAEARERNKTRDGMPNAVSAMVPLGNTDPTHAPAVADTPDLAHPDHVPGPAPDPTTVPIAIEHAVITVASDDTVKIADADAPLPPPQTQP